MTYTKIIISFLIIVSCSFQVAAQQREEDINRKKGVEAPVEDIVADEGRIGFNQSEADTVLRINHLLTSGDSVMALKNAKPFTYAKNLDSLLKALQKEETIQADVKPGALAWLDKFFTSKITITIFWLLAGAFVAFILYKLFFTRGFFRRPSTKNNINGLIADEDEVFVAADHDKLIAEAVSNKNYRLAVRYLYLQTLQQLAAAGLIQFATDKTNRQYLIELSKKPYANEFSNLTLNYEYTWYGEFEIDEPAFLRIRQKFKQFNNQL